MDDATQKKAHAWQAYDGSVCATGVDSIEEFAEAVRSEEGRSFSFVIEPDFDLTSPSFYRIPVGHYRQEQWDGSFMYPCSPDAKPGRGFVKVAVAL